ncbi:hypothetical protein IE81DRAFT_346819 [Ceraceosorus guamensis]|uniref:Uncharacterized protein n=1 Tax=Ceraceosorus guamensis TaxID=1522189 RepID=A0A316W6D4_9BASI|nr:hypothetical protein IE81DRAFT_346819 [Ceraceosorus guamensis]PWN43225.1 hypothetical protein IE81DRAFT_346819 [Ceraceosorus guamensis]
MDSDVSIEMALPRERLFLQKHLFLVEGHSAISRLNFRAFHACGGYISTGDRDSSILDVDDPALKAASKQYDEIKKELRKVRKEVQASAKSRTKKELRKIKKGVQASAELRTKLLDQRNEEADAAVPGTVSAGDKADIWLRREITSAFEGMYPPGMDIIDGYLYDLRKYESSESFEQSLSMSDLLLVSTAQTNVSIESSADFKSVAHDDTQVQLGRSIKSLPTRPSVRMLDNVLLLPPFSHGTKRFSDNEEDSGAKRLRPTVALKKVQREVPMWICMRRLRRHQEDIERRMKLKRRADKDVPLKRSKTKRCCLAGNILVSQDTLFQLLVPRAASSTSPPNSPILSSYIRTETRVRRDSFLTNMAMGQIAQGAPIIKRGKLERLVGCTVASLETMSIA